MIDRPRKTNGYYEQYPTKCLTDQGSLICIELSTITEEHLLGRYHISNGISNNIKGYPWVLIPVDRSYTLNYF
jgi:hypothetical protein